MTNYQTSDAQNLYGCMGEIGDDPYYSSEIKRQKLYSYDIWTEEEIQNLEKMFLKTLGDKNESNNLE